jgi:hypothetical protein
VYEINMHDIWVTSGGIPFTSCSGKMGQLVENMKWRGHTHTHINRRHDYLFSPIVTFYGMNGEERQLNGYQVFAMTEQVSRVHRNKKKRTEK